MKKTSQPDRHQQPVDPGRRPIGRPQFCATRSKWKSATAWSRPGKTTAQALRACAGQAKADSGGKEFARCRRARARGFRRQPHPEISANRMMDNGAHPVARAATR